MIWLDQILQGTLLGGYYALIACGLSLMFGVMRIINLANGGRAIQNSQESLRGLGTALPLSSFMLRLRGGEFATRSCNWSGRREGPQPRRSSKL